MTKETKLHEILALMGDSQNEARTILGETTNTFSKKADHFRGLLTAISFFDEKRQGENTTESKEVVTTVAAKLDHTANIIGRHWNLLMQLEDANQRATADVVIDGQTIIASAPATFLLGMENRLKEFISMLRTVPTLDPAMRWDEDASTGDGIYRSPPQPSFRMEKELKHKTLVEATKEHPAQVREYTEDTRVARIETTHFAGMISAQEKADLIARAVKLRVAVQSARQKANGAVVDNKRKPAKAMFDYILRGAT